MSPELLSRYRVSGLIGEGTYGLVYKAKKLTASLGEEPGDYAIKMIKRSPNEIERPSVTSISTLREIKLLRELHHENIVNLTDVVIDPKGRDVALVMDFAAWTLESVLKDHRKRREKIPDYTSKALMHQSLKGLEYLHANWVLHRDLKPQNMLIIGDGEKRGLLQLADLGLARIFLGPVKALGAVDKTVVTLWYRAPELLLGANHYTTAVDVWSLGCIFAELFFAHSPAQLALFPSKPHPDDAHASFERAQCARVYSMLGLPTPATWPDVDKLPNYAKLVEMKDQFPSSSVLHKGMAKLATPHQIDKAFMDLLASMLELDPSKRISAADALAHPYFDQFVKQIPAQVRRNALDDPTHDAYGRKCDYPREEPKPLSPTIQKAQREALEKARNKRSRSRKRQRF